MNLQKTILAFKNCESPSSSISIASKVDVRALLIVTVLYLIFLLSIPLNEPEHIIWFTIYPILMAPLANLSYSSILFKSLYVLPFIILIGIFNPFFDTTEAFKIGEFTVTSGWISFFSLIIRGLLAVQALLILIKTAGFNRLCSAFNHLGLPRILTIQLQFLYRFISVLAQEALNLRRAVISRAYGKKSFPIKIWVQLVGCLLVRSIDKSRSIHNSMLARGFDGSLPVKESRKVSRADIIFLSIWSLTFFMIYNYNLTLFLF